MGSSVLEVSTYDKICMNFYVLTFGKTAISGNPFVTAVPDKATYILWVLESSRKYNIKLLAATCFSCSPPDLNFLVTYPIFVYV